MAEIQKRRGDPRTWDMFHRTAKWQDATDKSILAHHGALRGQDRPNPAREVLPTRGKDIRKENAVDAKKGPFRAPMAFAIHLRLSGLLTLSTVQQ